MCYSFDSIFDVLLTAVRVTPTEASLNCKHRARAFIGRVQYLPMLLNVSSRCGKEIMLQNGQGLKNVTCSFKKWDPNVDCVINLVCVIPNLGSFPLWSYGLTCLNQRRLEHRQNVRSN